MDIDEKGITLCWLNINDGMIKAEIMAIAEGESIDDVKEAALMKLGIEVQDGESFLNAWSRAMHEENDLEFSIPSHPAITDAVMQSAPIMRFVWWLA